MALNIPSRVLHDLGLAAWFGGTLANAVALNRAAGAASDASSTGRVANEGWNAWTPVNAAAIGLHLGGAIGQLNGNKDRLATQQGVGTMAIVKTVLTAAALGVTAYSRSLGQVVNSQNNPSSRSGTKPTKRTKAEIAAAQEQLDALQWVIPALTGTLVAISSYAGEQQRASEVIKGVARR